MEKYTKFSDLTTGCHPFIPTWTYLPRSSIIVKYLYYTVCLLFIPFRFLLFCVGLLCLVILRVIESSFSHFPGFQRHIRFLLESLPLRFLLISLGIHSVTTKKADSRRLKIRSQYNSNENYLTSGDIILSNLTNISEVIYLLLHYQPLFIKFYSDHSMDIVSLWDIVKHVLYHQPMDLGNNHRDTTTQLNKTQHSKGQFHSMIEASLFCQQQHYPPLVIFPEEQKTNGTAILEWDIQTLIPKQHTSMINKEFYKMIQEHIVLCVFQYSKNSIYSPPHTVYGPFYHLFRMMLEPYHSVTFTWTTHQQIQDVLHHMHHERDDPLPTEVLDSLRQTMVRLLPGTQLVKVKGNRLAEFSTYFLETQHTQYKQSYKTT